MKYLTLEHEKVEKEYQRILWFFPVYEYSFKVVEQYPIPCTVTIALFNERNIYKVLTKRSWDIDRRVHGLIVKSRFKPGPRGITHYCYGVQMEDECVVFRSQRVIYE